MPRRNWRAREHRIEGEIHIGGQEHFYLETQATIAWLDASGGVSLHSSTQHPSETQEIVARVLGVPRHMVTVECLRMGGAFGGKETQANCFAAVAALGARKTGRPVRIRFSRRLDMTITGKRHPFLARFAAGFDDDGRMQAARIHLYADGGWSLDLSEAILGRAMFHVDNAYYLPAVEVTGFVCKTHKTSQTAFRGFGGPQGMLVIEDILDRIARTLGLPPRRRPRAQFLSRRPVHALWPAGEGCGAHRAHLGAAQGIERVRGAPRGGRPRSMRRTRIAAAASPSLRSSSASPSPPRCTIRPERSCWCIATAACR